MTKESGEMTVLLVEDNSADVAFFKEAVEASQVRVCMHVVTHGQEALQFLTRQSPFANAPRPDVIVLDLNLPVMNGQAMLVKMMAEPNLKDIPVAVLTTSTSERCVCDICPPGRCLYFTKTEDFKKLQDIVSKIIAHAKTAKSD